MREIVFRGKRTDNGEWVEGWYIHTKRHHCIITGCIDDGYVVYGHYASDVAMYVVNPATVGQYTGKVVKTGKVFDGDIGKSIDGIFLVCWDDEKAAFVMRFNEYPYETLYLEEMWDDAEIIGNIHDNGELLEVR